MSFVDNYLKWLGSDKIDEETKKELMTIKDDIGEIESRFCSMLEFGTAGLRGIIGVGLQRMNVYTVRYATQGLANLIIGCGKDAQDRGVCIAYDSRLMSDEFARQAAAVLAKNNIKVYIFDELKPTPELSFSIRYKGAIAGINITASHNPKEYNGYKVYWEDGAQLSPEHAKIVYDQICSLDIFDDVMYMNYDDALKSGIVETMGEEIDREFLKCVKAQAIDLESVRLAAPDFKIIYTPLHGTGYKLVPQIFEMIGIKNILTVREQMVPDCNFSTVVTPNPENKEGFTLGIELAKKENVDLIVASDPDCDRMGIVVRTHEGEYVTLSGNQVGALLADYIIKGLSRTNKMPKNPIIIKTIVSSDMVLKIAKQNNIEIIDVLTGFKFIGEKIKEFEETGEYSFIFGYEESYGYLKGTYCRDKDAVVASMLVSEMACYYKTKGMTLYDAMLGLYNEYGYFLDEVINIVSDSPDGLKTMQRMMEYLRENPPSEIGGFEVIEIRDYKTGEVICLSDNKKTSTGLPKSNVLYYKLSDNSKFIVRPSGTEPKIKIYFLINGSDMTHCRQKYERFKAYSEDILKKI